MKTRRHNLYGILLLGIFLQALVLASVHRHSFNPADFHFAVSDCNQQSSYSVESGSEHCYVCDFLTTVQLYASGDDAQVAACFETPQFIEYSQDLFLEHIQSFSTRAPPAVFC